MTTYHVKLKGLTVGYGNRPLIRDISIDIRRGEILTLIGPNGSGKSTILKSIIGQLRLLAGSVLIAERDGAETMIDTAEMSGPERSRKMAAVLTKRPQTELMTCHDVVAMGRYPYTGRLGVLSREDEERVEDAIRIVNASDIGYRNFNEISDGQKQRVLLARALCQEPEVLILDEPTSYLDLRHKLDLLEILKEMSRDHHLTVIMSLHEIDLAQKVSDHVMAVKGETIYGYGRPADIFREDLIRDLYDLNNGTYDPLFGSVELPAVSGDPEVFVLSSGGSGIPVFRRLQQTGVPFAAGILYKNDIDYPLAKKLAAQVISEEPFREIGEDAYRKAERLIRNCRCVIDAGFAREKMNRRMSDLAALADDLGILEKRRLD